MARIRTLVVVALLALSVPVALGAVVFDEVFVGASVAAMYPSGAEWDAANNRIVVADTGRNRILFYSLTGNRQGGFGSHGNGNGKFDTPRDVAIDDSGRIYVADAANDRVQAFTTNGSFRWKTTPSPCGPNGACVNNPIGLTWDSENNVLLVASTGQDRVKAYSANGAYLWESPPPGDIGIDASRGLRDVARQDGRIWIADYGNHRIVAYDVSPNGLTWDTTPAIVLGPVTTGGQLNLNFPYNVDFSTNGDFAYVSSTGNSQVAVWDLTGAPTFERIIGTKCSEPCPNPIPGSPNNRIEDLRRVLVAENDQVITADFWGNGLKVFNPNGNVVRDIEGDSPRPRGLAEAFGVDVGPNGTVYAVDRLNQEVEWYSPNGTFRGTAGSRGTQPDEFSWPEGIAAANDGVWTADSRSGRIQFWSPNLNDGAPTVVDLGVTGYVHDLDTAPNGDVFAAVGTATGATSNRVYRVFSIGGGNYDFETFGPVLDDPQGVAVGGNFVYVANAGANEIVKLRRSDGVVVDRSSLTLHGPQGVAVAPNGKVWVADTRANRVLRLTPQLDLIESFKPRRGKAFDLPHTLAVSPDGDFLYVADTFNNRIQRYRI